jgi:hypothetical protein
MSTYVRNSLMALGVGLIATLGSLSAVAATGATVTKVEFEVSEQGQEDIEECVGEHVTFTDGQFNVATRGNMFHRNVMSGVGTGDDTGTLYRASGHIQETYNEGTSDGWTYTFTLLLNVVAQDGSGQFTARATFHMTARPSGEIVAYVDVFEIRCR